MDGAARQRQNLRQRGQVGVIVILDFDSPRRPPVLRRDSDLAAHRALNPLGQRPEIRIDRLVRVRRGLRR